MTESTATPASRKRSVLLSVGFLLLVAAVMWAFDGWLLLRLRLIASETFSAERTSNPMLSVDAVHELVEYSPSRLAKFLSTPSVQIRSVVCLSLEGRRGLLDPNKWVGVAPALLAVARQTEDDELKQRALMAAWHVNIIPDEDVEAVFAFADERIAAPNGQWGLASKLLETVAGSNARQIPRVLKTLERSLVLADKTDLNETLRRLARVAPESREAAAGAMAILALPFPNMTRELEIRRLDEILLKQPALLDEMARGTQNHRLAAFEFLLKYRNPEASSSVSRSTPTRATWPPERLALMERSAADFLDPAIPEILDVDAAFRMLSGAVDGPERLFELAKQTNGRRRISAVRAALAGARDRSQPLAEQFFVARLPILAAWMAEDDHGIQAAIVTELIPGARNPDWLKAQRTGPDSPIVAAARNLLERHPGRLDYHGLALFSDSGPIAERDVELIVAALDRLLRYFRANYEWSSVKPQGSLGDVYRKLFDRMKPYSDRASVKNLFERRRELEAEGILR